MISGNTHLKRTLMLGAFAVVGTLALATTPTFARNAGPSNGQSATMSSSMPSDKDADDMTRSSTSVSGNVIPQPRPDADDTMRSSDRDDKVRADARKKSTDADERSARANDHDGDDTASRTRIGRNNSNANGRFAADRDRGFDRAADRHERHYFMRASYRHYRHHHHIVLRDRDRDLRTMNDRDRDDMRTNDRDRDDMKSPSGH
jgi:hypothetical protein